MIWRETTAHDERPGPSTADVVFAITCPRIAEDHSAALFAALSPHLPWLSNNPAAGIHAVHGAATGNGWQRPEVALGGDGIMHLSRRARLVIRAPDQDCAEQAVALSGLDLEVGEHRLQLGSARIRPLRGESTQRARRVLGRPQESEADFVARMVQDLAGRGIAVRKLLCGRSGTVRDAGGRPLETRSVLLAELSTIEALAVQCFSLGGGGHLGCGLFEPHRGIAPASGSERDASD